VKPLAHLRVLDLTVNMPGPFCSMILADLGARVIKVEPPGGDPLRQTPGMFRSVNRGKESLVLNLKVPEARQVLHRLAASADVVLEGWRPGVATRLGADYQALSASNPGLVYCSISGFGREGPWRDRAGHDINYLAVGGYLALQARVGGRPWPPPILVSDLTAGLYAAVAVLAALAARSVTGLGTWIDLAMTDAVVALLGPEIGRASEEGGTPAHPNVTFIPHYGLFPCADGRWLSLGIVHEDHFWKRLCDAAGLDDLRGLAFADRLARAPEIRAALHATFVTKPAHEWERRLADADVPAATVLELEEVLSSFHFRARGLFVELDGHRYAVQPMRLAGQRLTPGAGPPGLGEHAEAILAQLGVTPAEVEDLRRAGALG
jgi:crotonobetainyl-CoA:carnitine CoA-transferase CaiB-like acyl-CoA transferase